MNEGIHLDLDTWIVPGQIRKANLCRGLGNSPQSANPPSDQELMAFREKIAGIKIQETKPNDEGKQYNYVSEVHPAAGFKSVTGHRKIVSPVVTHTHVGVDSALSRNARKPTEDEFDSDEIPF